MDTDAISHQPLPIHNAYELDTPTQPDDGPDGLPAIQQYVSANGTPLWLTPGQRQAIREREMRANAPRIGIVGRIMNFLRRIQLRHVVAPALLGALAIGVFGGVMLASEGGGDAPSAGGPRVTALHGATPPPKDTAQSTPNAGPGATATPGKTPTPAPTKTPTAAPSPTATPSPTSTQPPSSGIKIYDTQYTNLLSNPNDPSSVVGNASPGQWYKAVCSMISSSGEPYILVYASGQKEYIDEADVSTSPDSFNPPTSVPSCG